jgi:hypothetical protein
MKKKLLIALSIALVAVSALAACSGKKDSNSGTDSNNSTNKNSAVNRLQTAIQNQDSAAVIEAVSNIEPEAYVNAIRQGMPSWALTESIKGISPEVKHYMGTAGATPASNFSYDLNKTGDGIIIKTYTGNSSIIFFPSEIEGYPVVQIGDGRIAKKGTLRIIIIPEGVKIIGNGTFGEQILESVVFPSTLIEIRGAAFSGTTLQYVDLSHTALTTIGGSAFAGGWEINQGLISKGSLISVKLPDTVTKIGSDAFSHNPRLKDINIPANIKTIEDWAFGYGHELTNLTIPDSITAIHWASTGFNMISYQAFKGCGKLPIRTRQRLQELGYKWDF